MKLKYGLLTRSLLFAVNDGKTCDVEEIKMAITANNLEMFLDQQGFLLSQFRDGYTYCYKSKETQ